MNQKRGTRTSAIMFLLREYIETTGAKYTRFLDYIDRLADDEDHLREVYTEERDTLKANLDEAKGYLKALEGH